ncbi:MAG: SDR family NAD(P)-dependent oxidoreductase [Ilumatobacteraceae bacterium]
MDELRFDGATAVVTGAGRGLGRAHAILLAARGAQVVVADIRMADEVADEIVALGGEAIGVAGSVADGADVERLMATARTAFGPIDIVVNNAGISRPEPLSSLSLDNLQAELSIHLLGTIRVTQAAWKDLRASAWGAVINTTSGVGLFGLPGASSYAAAKMGIIGATRSLALEGARHGVRVNAIAPIARTAMAGDVFADLTPVLDPELVSSVVVWLAHPSCTLSGQVLSAGGGRVARVAIEVGIGELVDDLTPEDVATIAPRVLAQPSIAMSDAMAEVDLIRQLRSRLPG